ncbi:hypothetical protein MNBD_GAMMA09-3185 [hydrothermal vent metagenome]|uniref:Uncharacterized protein n=1 Tax=hydrothermal vent metagenome TaxID=652676 RepID=A0A3B0XUX8_9ZZZZ
MHSKLTATIRFCFKGQTHEPSIEIKLAEYMRTPENYPDICMMIARANDFDMYSYEYEMMQAENITFSDASGLVADYINDGMLDFVSFEQAWEEKRCLTKLADLARNILSIDDLEQSPDLKKALLEAYKLGRT